MTWQYPYAMFALARPSIPFTFLHAILSRLQQQGYESNIAWLFQMFTAKADWTHCCWHLHWHHWPPGNLPPNSRLPFSTATLGALCDHLAKSHVVKHDNKRTCLCWTWQHSRCSHLFLSFALISIVTLQLAELHWNSLASYQSSIRSVSVALPLLAWQKQHHIPARPCPALMLCIVAGPGPGSHNDALQSCYIVKLSSKCNPAWQYGQVFRWWPQSCCTWFQDQVWPVSKQSSSFDNQPSSNTDQFFQSKHLM